jgi:hypothetical protein
MTVPVIKTVMFPMAQVYPVKRMWKLKVSCGSFVFLKLAKELEAERRIIFKFFI